MTDNIPILYRNIMDFLPSDFARDVFLWAVERPGEGRMCYRAEAFAREAEILVRTLMPMLNAAARARGKEKHDPGLLGFILKRHANWRLGGNQSPTYAGAA